MLTSRSRLTTDLLWTAFIAWALTLAFSGIFDTDIWFHMAGGRYTAQNLHPPITDPFSYPSADNPYICLHWLFQLLLYGGYQLAGPTGLVILKAIFISSMLISCGAALGIRRCDGSLALLALTTLACAANLTLRPILLTLIYLSLMLTIWRRNKSTWLFPLIQLFWINTQGLFILGLFVCGLWWLEAPKQRWKILTATVAVCIINPYGIHGILFPFLLFTRISGSNVYSLNIQEFASLARSSFYLKTPAGWACLLLIAGLFAAFIHAWKAGQRKRLLSPLLLTAGFLFLYTRAMRNIPLFAVTAAWAISYLTPSLMTWNLKGIRQKSLTICLIIILIVALNLRQNNRGYPGILRKHHADTPPAQLATLAYPMQAADYLNRHNWKGRLFNDFNWGGYLIYALTPTNKVFIDPRLEVHSQEHFADYVAMTKDPVRFHLLDQTYNFDLAIFCHVPCRGNPRLFQILHANPNWHLVYADAMAVIFCKNTPANQTLLANPHINIPSAPNFGPLRGSYLQDPISHRLNWHKPNITDTCRDIAYAHFKLFTGKPQPALAFLLRAAKRNPQIGDVHFFLATAAAATGDPQLSQTALQAAKITQPNHPEIKK